MNKNIEREFALLLNLDKEKLNLIENKLKEFKNFENKDNNAWFSELCFCILTANSKAKTAIEIQNHIGESGFLNKSQEEIAQIIRSYGHRFHNNKAKYIVQARKYKNIKDILENLNIEEKREFLVKNINGLGYKEASHFLRNVGFSNYAIVDRHILRFLNQHNYIKEIPKIINKKVYLDIEDKLKKFNIALDKLDLMIWFYMTGTILK